jgi:hypothetical protein
MTMFRRHGSTILARFHRQEAQVLRQCVAELAALLAEEPDHDDPAVERLFPDVYPEDPGAAAEFRRYTETDLRNAKLSQARDVLSNLLEAGGEVRLAEETADVWLRTLTDVRLVLGTRLGVDDDMEIEAELDAAVGKDPTSPRVGQLSVYAFLSYLQESLVGALMSQEPA